MKLLRPSREVAERFPNATAQQRLDDLIATRLGRSDRRGNNFEAVFFTSASFPGLELSCARGKYIVREEGHTHWDVPTRVPRGGARAGAGRPADAVPVAEIVEEREEIPEEIFQARNRAEDIALVRGQGFEVDDDNDPAPENVPAVDEAPPVVNDLLEGQEWGWDGIDRRVVAGGNYNEPSFPNNWVPQGKSYLDLFIYFFPMVWFTTVLVAKTSAAIVESGLHGSKAPVTFGEMIRFLGIRLLMSTQQGWTVDDYWRYSEAANQTDLSIQNAYVSFQIHRDVYAKLSLLTYKFLGHPIVHLVVLM